MMNIQIVNVPNMDLCSFNFYIPLGRADEPENAAGISHLIEHLIFHGHPQYNQEEFVGFFEERGGYLNGETDMDSMCVYGRINKRYLDEAIKIVVEAIKFFDINERNVEIEKKIIKKEIELFSKTFSKKILIRSNELLYEGHAYGRDINEILGIESMCTKNIKKYYSNLYSIKNWKIIIVGDVSEETFLKQYYIEDKIIKKNYQFPMKYNLTTVEEKLSCGEGVAITWPVVKDNNSTLHCKLALNTLAGGMSSPLYSKYVKENGLCYGIACNDMNLLYSDSMTIGLKCDKSMHNKVINIFEGIYEGIISRSIFAEGDIRRGKERTITEFYLRRENLGRQSRYISRGIVFHNKLFDINKEVNTLNEFSIDSCKEVIYEILSQKYLLLKSI